MAKQGKEHNTGRLGSLKKVMTLRFEEQEFKDLGELAKQNGFSSLAEFIRFSLRKMLKDAPECEQ